MRTREEIIKELKLLEEKRERLQKTVDEIEDINKPSPFVLALRMTLSRIRVLKWVLGESERVEDND